MISQLYNTYHLDVSRISCLMCWPFEIICIPFILVCMYFIFALILNNHLHTVVYAHYDSAFIYINNHIMLISYVNHSSTIIYTNVTYSI